MKENLNPWSNFKSDIPASIVVFLVAMPLCLGVALASGAPLYSGLISGIVGGIVVGSLSGSPLGVSGPAAGLAVIVVGAIATLGSFEAFLVAVLLAGVLQVLMGFARAGVIAYYFPSSVVHAMLAGIGILIFMKQIPHAFGYDKNPEGQEAFLQPDGQNTFSEILNMLNYIDSGVIMISVISLAILILWENKSFQKLAFAKIIKGPLVAVTAGIILGFAFNNTSLAISQDHFVMIPLASSASEFFSNFRFPDFSVLGQSQVYITAIVLAVVGSLETLLCAEASDKQDTYKRITPVNRELMAQGVGNIVCGLIGGIPVTQVIVRSSVNQQSGGKTKASAIFHGILLLISIIAIPNILNMIPLATLAAILLVVGYKLAKPALFKKMYHEGWEQFVPFMVTIIGILLTDLLTGIGLGMVVAILVILRNNYRVPYKIIDEKIDGKNKIILKLSEDVTFLNKASILQALKEIPDDSILEIDMSNTHFIHHDVLEILSDFKQNAAARDIQIITKGVVSSNAKKISELELLDN